MSSIKLTADSGGGTFEIKAPSSGSNTRILTIPDEAGTILTSATSTGKLLQVVQTTKTDTASSSVASGGTWVPTTPKCSITPSNASNKILVQANITVALAQNSHGMYLTVLKAGSPMFVGDQEGSNMERTTVGTLSYNDYNFGTLFFNYLDTAGSAGSAIEYSIRLSHDSGSSTTIYLNRTEATDNVDDRKRGASSIVLTELAAWV